MKTCCICGKTETETRIIGSYCRKHYLQIYRHGKILDRTIYDKNKIDVINDIAYMDLYDKDGNVAKQISEENAAPLHFSQPVGGVAEGHGTGTPTGNAEPSPKPTFSCCPYDVIKRNITRTNGYIINPITS